MSAAERIRDLGLDFPVVIAEVAEEDDAWRELRYDGLGGSDAAASGGFSPWKSPYALWVEKTERISTVEETTRMKWGKRLEDGIARGYAEDYERHVEKLPLVLAHPDYPWMRANVDRVVLGDDGKAAGLLEVKNTTGRNSDDWDETAPLQYQLQGLHYLAVTGLPWVDLFGLLGGNTPRTFRVVRKEDDIANLIEIESAFWKLVQDGTPPAYDGLPGTLKLVKSFYSDAAEGSQEEVGAEFVDALRRWKAAKERKKEIQREIDAAETEIVDRLGSHEAGVFEGEIVATRKTRKGYRVEAHDVAPTRVLRIPKGAGI